VSFSLKQAKSKVDRRPAYLSRTGVDLGALEGDFNKSEPIVRVAGE